MTVKASTAREARGRPSEAAGGPAGSVASAEGELGIPLQVVARSAQAIIRTDISLTPNDRTVRICGDDTADVQATTVSAPTLSMLSRPLALFSSSRRCANPFTP